MRKVIGLLIVVLFLTVNCRFSNDAGECIGFDDKEVPGIEYEISTRNAVWTALGSEMIWPVILWIVRTAKCPIEPEVK